jgi:putative acetyltransferase
MPPFVFRAFEPSDAGAVSCVVKAAFGSDREVALIETLRRESDMVCEFVAATPSELIGHVAFSRLSMQCDGASLRAVALAPLAVAPAHQRSGVGKTLTRFALSALREAREEVVLVLGHPNYYRVFGFSPLLAKLLEAPYSGDAFMALELRPGALASMRWKVTYARAFSE